MALDLLPNRNYGRTNFQRVVGKLARWTAAASCRGSWPAARRCDRSRGLLGYNNTSFRERPVKAALIGAGDEGRAHRRA